MKSFGDIQIICKGGSFEKNNWESYLQQMKRGMNAIKEADPDGWVGIAEHDVLYPNCFFKDTPPNPKVILKNTNLYFLNKSGYYGPHGTSIHSQTLAHVQTLLYCADEPVPMHKKFKNTAGGEYELNMVKNPVPSIDVRWGGNYTGPKGNARTQPEHFLQYWGDSMQWWGEIEKRNSEANNERTSTNRWNPHGTG